jgi:hypothetical protein
MVDVIELGSQEYLGAWYARGLDALSDLLLVVWSKGS